MPPAVLQLHTVTIKSRSFRFSSLTLVLAAVFHRGQNKRARRSTPAFTSRRIGGRIKEAARRARDAARRAANAAAAAAKKAADAAKAAAAEAAKAAEQAAKEADRIAKAAAEASREKNRLALSDAHRALSRAVARLFVGCLMPPVGLIKNPRFQPRGHEWMLQFVIYVMYTSPVHFCSGGGQCYDRGALFELLGRLITWIYCAWVPFGVPPPI